MISLHEGQGTAVKKKAGDRIFQLRWQVVGSTPAIWRRVLVRESMWLSRLHDAIQIAFDWYDYQTHAFNCDEVRYGNPLKREGFEIVDDRDVALADLELERIGRFSYGYHFGEGWQVEIVVEGAPQSLEKGVVYPRCIGGERAGPPEDCGGLEAFHDMLACLQEPHTELGQEWREWVGPEYDPERCDLAAINKGFSHLRK